MTLVIDIETSYQPESLSLPITEDDLNAGIGSNWKDPEKIKAKQDENRAAWTETIRKQACLDWRLGRIVAIGVEGEARMGDDEAPLLHWMWGKIDTYNRSAPVIGFNIRNFDLPWLFGRSATLGIRPSRKWSESRYSSKVIVDWCDILSNYGSMRFAGWTLGRYNEHFKLGADMYGEGAEVAGWVEQGEWHHVERHLLGDLDATARLHHRFAGLL